MYLKSQLFLIYKTGKSNKDLTWCDVTFSNLTTTCVVEDVVSLRRHITSSLDVNYLEVFGILYVIGLTFLLSIRAPLRTTTFSLFIWRVYRDLLNFILIIWLACVWAIWKERNNRVFTNAAINPLSIVEKVKLNSFLWLPSNFVPIAFGFHDWWRHPLLCMSVM